MNTLLGGLLLIWAFLSPNDKNLALKLPLNATEFLLYQNGVSSPVVQTVQTVLYCSKIRNLTHNNIISVLDFSLPSNQKRLWVFDLNQNKLLFHTYASHGIYSGAKWSHRFSNLNNSKASSIGVYQSKKTYYGRHGLSMSLHGLDPNFNDRAEGRAIVMHGAWYVEEPFIKKYGRAGRSWGCPAVPDVLAKPIMTTLSPDAIIIAYYGNNDWFARSKFLNCDNITFGKFVNGNLAVLPQKLPPTKKREPVLFTIGKTPAENAVLAIPALSYERVFQTKVPLARMLRRQIGNQEYIALSQNELNKLVDSANIDSYADLSFVIPIVKMSRGYYATEMHPVNLGQVKAIHKNDLSNLYTVTFDSSNSVQLRPANYFVRWIGL